MNQKKPFTALFEFGYACDRFGLPRAAERFYHRAISSFESETTKLSPALVARESFRHAEQLMKLGRWEGARLALIECRHSLSVILSSGCETAWVAQLAKVEAAIARCCTALDLAQASKQHAARAQALEFQIFGLIRQQKAEQKKKASGEEVAPDTNSGDQTES